MAPQTARPGSGEANEYYDGYGSESAAKSEAGVLKTKYPHSTLYTVGFGLGDNGNNVMSPSGKNGNKSVDKYYPADDADELKIVYNNINTGFDINGKHTGQSAGYTNHH